MQNGIVNGSIHSIQKGALFWAYIDFLFIPFHPFTLNPILCPRVRPGSYFLVLFLSPSLSQLILARTFFFSGGNFLSHLHGQSHVHCFFLSFFLFGNTWPGRERTRVSIDGRMGNIYQVGGQDRELADLVVFHPGPLLSRYDIFWDRAWFFMKIAYIVYTIFFYMELDPSVYWFWLFSCFVSPLQGSYGSNTNGWRYGCWRRVIPRQKGIFTDMKATLSSMMPRIILYTAIHSPRPWGNRLFSVIFKFARQVPAFFGGFYSVSSNKKYQGTRTCLLLSSFVLAYLGILFAFAVITHFWCHLYFFTDPYKFWFHQG